MAVDLNRASSTSERPATPMATVPDETPRNASTPLARSAACAATAVATALRCRCDGWVGTSGVREATAMVP
eukprot:scaffold555_cov109-Isochrysis_galbana.AAC.12